MVVKEEDTCNETAHCTGSNVWKELISQSRNKGSKLDKRTQITFDALREKLKIK